VAHDEDGAVRIALQAGGDGTDILLQIGAQVALSVANRMSCGIRTINSLPVLMTSTLLPRSPRNSRACASSCAPIAPPTAAPTAAPASVASGRVELFDVAPIRPPIAAPVIAPVWVPAGCLRSSVRRRPGPARQARQEEVVSKSAWR
jgi:hypothetical protein